jgi:beta-glucanase (GH16 family)
MKLVWSEEFDYKGQADPKKWSYSVGGNGWGNNELQYYTDGKPENSRVEDGKLIIETRKETFGNNKYTSAKLITSGKGDWTYGRIEVRAKLPEGRGTWPAIWMVAAKDNRKWPDDGEIDIMEHVGFDPGVIHGTVHTKAYYHSIGTQKGGKTTLDDPFKTYHTYTIEWNEDKIDWFIDDRQYFTFLNDKTGNKETWPFNDAFYLILNVAVGGNWGGQKGVDDSIWPQRMEVDYVRVYQSK